MDPLTILGTGAYTLPIVSSEELLGFLGKPKDPAWLEERTGIRGHSLNFDCSRGVKRSKQDVFDYALAAAREAMAEAGMSGHDINQLVFVSCTSRHFHFSSDAIQLHRMLGLRPDAVVDQIDSGCAGLAKAFQLVERYAYNRPQWTALVIGANDVSSFLDRDRYLRVPDAWLSPAMFADGAGAVVLGPGESWRLSLIATQCAVDGKFPLVEYAGGGTACPTREDTLDAHAYVMDSREVARQFVPALDRALDALTKITTVHQDRVDRWYLHQANLRLIEHFVKKRGLEPERVPHNVDRIGNTVNASTLLLLHEDAKTGIIPMSEAHLGLRSKAASIVMFALVGAGMMEGGAVFARRRFFFP